MKTQKANNVKTEVRNFVKGVHLKLDLLFENCEFYKIENHYKAHHLVDSKINVKISLQRSNMEEGLVKVINSYNKEDQNYFYIRQKHLRKFASNYFWSNQLVIGSLEPAIKNEDLKNKNQSITLKEERCITLSYSENNFWYQYKFTGLIQSYKYCVAWYDNSPGLKTN